jgi:hypothetical protein
MLKLMRVVKYLPGTRNYGLVYCNGIPFDPALAADASQYLYFEGHGHAGLIIFNGSAPVEFRSIKINPG